MNMENDEKKDVNSEECTGSSCCMPSGEGDERSKKSRVRAIIFIIIVSAAVGVAATSVLKKDSNKTNSIKADKLNQGDASANTCAPQAASCCPR